MRGLVKATNYYNNAESRRQHARAVALATKLGIQSPLLSIDTSAMGWRRRDRVTVQILCLLGLSWDELDA